MSISYRPQIGGLDAVSLVTINATPNGLTVDSSQVLTLALSSTSTVGALSSTDWNTFNGKQAAGNYITALTGDATASGPGSVALTLATVNSNVGSFGGATSVSAITVNAKGLVTAAASTSIQIAESQVTNLVSDLAGKQATGNYITALTGDATASGPGSVALTLATVNSNVGSFGGATSVSAITVNAKGLVTAAASTSIQIAESQVTSLVSDLALKAPLASPTFTGIPAAPTASQGNNSTQLATTAYVDTGLATKQATGNYITALTGDITASGPGSVAATLATVNSNTGSFGSSTAIPSFTVNGKGLITAASTNVVIAPAGTLTGTTLASNVVTSSLTSVGTITTGVWTGTALAIANGGTGQTAKTAAFDALSPTTTKGDLTISNGTNNIRVAVGADGTYLQANSANASGTGWATPGTGGDVNLYLDSGNGHGSTNTNILRFTNSRNNTLGAYATYADSATAGMSITVNTAGLYAFELSQNQGAAAESYVITVNDSALATAAGSSTYAQGVRIRGDSAAGIYSNVAGTIRCAVNDVIRAKDDGQSNQTSVNSYFKMTRIGD